MKKKRLIKQIVGLLSDEREGIALLMTKWNVNIEYDHNIKINQH
jgi:hypothetical protein